MLPLQLTPHIMALPYLIGALDPLLEAIAERPESRFATGSEILAAWKSVY